MIFACTLEQAQLDYFYPLGLIRVPIPVRMACVAYLREKNNYASIWYGLLKKKNKRQFHPRACKVQN